MNDEEKKYVQLAIAQARKSAQEGGFPAGAVIVKDGQIVSQAVSTGYIQHDPSGHAEITAIREACKNLKTVNLVGAVMYESLECCVMCFSAAYWAGISKIVYACQKAPDMVAKQYYEGTVENQTLNKENTRQIKLVFAPEFADEALEVIQDWETQGGFNK